MSTALDLDIATLVGEMEDVPCESAGHGDPYDSHVHEGPATEYCRTLCSRCGTIAVKAYCAPFMVFIRHTDKGLICSICGGQIPKSTSITILGPVNGRAS